MKQQTETDLVRGCLALLKLRGYMAWRNNTGAYAATYKGKRRFIRYGAPGSPDILAIEPPHGRLLAIECKLPGRKTTAAQKEFLARVGQAGGRAFVVHSIEELEAGFLME